MSTSPVVRWDDEAPAVKWDDEQPQAPPTGEQLIRSQLAARGLNLPVSTPAVSLPATSGVSPTKAPLLPSPGDYSMPGSFEGKPENLGEPAGEYLKAGPGRLASGAKIWWEGEKKPGDTGLSERYKGLGEMVAGAGTTALPLAAPALLANPVSLGLGVGGGYLMSKAAEKAANWANLPPEEREFWKNLAFWVPSVAGIIGGVRTDIAPGKAATISALGDRIAAGVAREPEGGFTVSGKVGGKVRSKTFGGPKEAAGPGIEPQTIKGEPGAVQKGEPETPNTVPEVSADHEIVARTEDGKPVIRFTKPSDETPQKPAGRAKPPSPTVPPAVPAQVAPAAPQGTEQGVQVPTAATGTPTEIHQAATEQQPELVKAAETIADQVPGAKVVDPGAKSVGAIERKQDSDREVTDAARAQIVVPDQEAKADAAQKITQQLPATEVQPIEAESLPIVAAKLPGSQEIQVATPQEAKTQDDTHEQYAAIQDAKAEGDNKKAAQLQEQLDEELAKRQAESSVAPSENAVGAIKEPATTVTQPEGGGAPAGPLQPQRQGIDYARMNQTYPKQKASLMRALNVQDAGARRTAVIESAKKAVAEWDQIGAWPDNWSRWQRAVDDQFKRGEHPPRLEDIADWKGGVSNVKPIGRSDSGDSRGVSKPFPSQQTASGGKKPLETKKIMGVESGLIQSVDGADGMKYDLYTGIGHEDRSHIVVTDKDSGKVASVTQYKTFPEADNKFNETVAKPSVSGQKPQTQVSAVAELRDASEQTLNERIKKIDRALAEPSLSPRGESALRAEKQRIEAAKFQRGIDKGATIETEKPGGKVTKPASPEGKGTVPGSGGAGAPAVGGVQPQTGGEAPERKPTGTISPEGRRADDTGTRPARAERPESRPSEGTGNAEHPAPTGRQPAGERQQRTAVVRRNTDWYSHPEDFSVAAGENQRLDWNLKALRLIKEISDNPRKLTDDEKDALAHFVGWGALQWIFEPYGAPYKEQEKWRKAKDELSQLLSTEEMQRARASTVNAHYTSPEVVRFMWDAAKRMGFRGGTVLEPAAGSGNFLGMMPKALRGQSHVIANELDSGTFSIMKQLYPSALLHNQNFVTLILPNDSIDLAISNVPFGEKIYDPSYPKLKAKIHDYFFVKTMDKVRPGGVISYITSTGTMDKANNLIREQLADQADLEVAFRLPSSSFAKTAGTSVTTDIVVLRKRLPGEAPGGEKWLNTVNQTLPVQSTDETATVAVNEYFANHPENVLGKPEISRRMYGSNRYDLAPIKDTTLQAQLADALSRIPRGIFDRMESNPIIGATGEANFVTDQTPEGAFTLDSKGNVKQNSGGKLVTPEGILDKGGKVVPAKQQRAKALIGLKESTNDLLRAMKALPDDAAGNTEIKQLQKDLLKKYVGYREKYGLLHASATKGVFEDDPHYPRLLSLENYDRTARKADLGQIFEKRTLFPPQSLVAISPDPKEGLYQILAERGFPDLDLMSQLSGKDKAELAKKFVGEGLIYREPLTGKYQSKDKYLSGNVRDKLRDAERAVAQGLDEYRPNVEALKKVIPPTVPMSSDELDANSKPKQIEIKLGATWIPTNVIRDFIRDSLDGFSSVQVTNPAGTWNIENAGRSPVIETELGNQNYTAIDLLQMALNQKQPVAYDVYSIPGGGTRRVVNEERTVHVRDLQHKLKDRFADWVRKSRHAKELEEAYNYAYNSLVTPEYDGSHLTFPGMNPAVTLRPHQVNAIWRVIQDGRGLLAHVMGAGKTFEMAATAMEMRRLGLAKKILIAVPNHLVGQWRKEFLTLYPGANLLVPTKKDFEATNRNRLMSRIATNDWDAIVVAHSQFNMMDISPERQEKTLNAQKEELEEAIRAAEAAEGRSRGGRGSRKSRTVKALENAKARLDARLAELANLKADRTINFDDTGIDTLMVDEAHEYKNLTFYTKMDRIAGLAQGDSKRAVRLKMKTEYLQDKYHGRGVIFGTGTPVQNTMAELNTMTRYVAPDLLEKAGIRFFDDWAANFGSTITAMELGADARTYKARSKFARFTNVPELMQMFRAFTDVKTQQDRNLPVPKVARVKIEVPTNPALEGVMRSLIARAAAIRQQPYPEFDREGNIVMKEEVDKKTGRMVKRPVMIQPGSRPDPTVDNMLSVTGDGRKAAIDLRLINPGVANEPESKLNSLIQGLYKEWEEGKADRNTHLVFLDNYRAMDDKGKVVFNLYDEIRNELGREGVPKDEIAVIHEHDTEAQKQALFDKVNAGDIRILIGSTQKMGAGMNVQRRLKSLHHVDLPWRPGDLEQREGRIVRQGNEFHSLDPDYTVNIYNYLTKGSFDAYMAQTLQRKAEFIWQLMSGKTDQRTMTDEAGEMVLSLEEMKQIASGNPDMKRKVDLEAEQTRLLILRRAAEAQIGQQKQEAEWVRLRAARDKAIADKLKGLIADYKEATKEDPEITKQLGVHEQTIDSLENDIKRDRKEIEKVGTSDPGTVKSLESRIAGNEKQLKDERAAYRKLEKESAAKFSLHVLGKDFDDATEANDFLAKSTVPPAGFHLNLNGIDFRAETKINSIIQKPYLEYSTPWDGNIHQTAQYNLESLIRSLRIVERNMTTDLERTEAGIPKLTKKAEKLEELAKGGGFTEQKELDKVSKELREVNVRLGLENEIELAEEQDVASEVDTSEEGEEPEQELEPVKVPDSTPVKPAPASGDTVLLADGDTATVRGSNPNMDRVALWDGRTVKMGDVTPIVQPVVKKSDKPTELENELAKRVERTGDELVADYIRDNTKDGTTYVSTDQAKSIFPEYVEDPTTVGDQVNQPAAAIAHAAWETLAARGPQGDKKFVRVLTGGPANGKTSAIKSASNDQVGINKESIFTTIGYGRQVIDAALNNGWEPQVDLVFSRDPAQQLQRMVKRAEVTGRVVAVEYMVDSTTKSPEIVQKLKDHYGDKLVVNSFDTTGAEPVFHEGTVQPAIDAAAAMTATARKEAMLAELENLRNSGQVSERIYNAAKAPAIPRTGAQQGGESSAAGPAAGGQEDAGVQLEGEGPGILRSSVFGLDIAAQKLSKYLGKADKAYDRWIDKFLQKAQMGRAFPQVEEVDPQVASDLRVLRAAPALIREEADHIVQEVVGNLTHQQERGLVLMADQASRDNLRENHPAEYAQFRDDKDIQAALKRYKPHEEEERKIREDLGYSVISEDYMRRVYADHVAGVDQKTTKGEVPKASFDRVITPQRLNNQGRKASAEWYYKNGLHEFGPAFATRYISTRLKLAEHKAAVDFLTKATKIDPKDGLPATIEYNGKTLYRGDIAQLIRVSRADSPEGEEIAAELGLKQLPKPADVKTYSLYDPTPEDKTDFQAKKMADLYREVTQRASGTKLTEKDFDELLNRANAVSFSKHTIYAGPEPIVEAFRTNAEYAIPDWLKTAGEIVSPLTGMIRRQLIGWGFGVLHIKNIMRAVLQERPGAHLDPRSWGSAWKVAFDKELRKRGIKGIEDPAFRALLAHAGISARGTDSFLVTLKTNFDDARWERAWNLVKAAGKEDVLFGQQVLRDIKTLTREGGAKNLAKAATTAVAGAIEVPFRPMLFIGHHNIFSEAGIDRAARLQYYDFLKAMAPGITDEEIANQTSALFGRYNQAGWTSFQDAVRPFMMFPGWGYRSFEWVLRHPLRSTLPAAFLIFMANQVLHQLGKNKKRDSTDLTHVHIGRYSVSDNLFSERLGKSLMGVPTRFLEGELEGKGLERSARQAVTGIPGDARAFIGEINPVVAAPLIELPTGKDLRSGRDIIPDKDKRKKFGPEKDLAEYGGRRLFPGYYELGNPDQHQRRWQFALRNLGTSVTDESKHRKY